MFDFLSKYIVRALWREISLGVYIYLIRYKEFTYYSFMNEGNEKRFESYPPPIVKIVEIQ